MKIFLESEFDCIFEFENVPYECLKGQPLVLSEINKNFMFKVHPVKLEENGRKLIPFSCFIKVDNGVFSSCENVRVTMLEKDLYFVRVIENFIESNIKIEKFDAYSIKTYAKNIEVFNADDIVLSSPYKKVEFLKEEKLLTIYSNYNEVLECGLIEKYSFNGGFKLIDRFSACDKQEKNGILNKPKNPEMLFYAVKAGYFSFVKSMLSENLKQTMQNEHLTDFFAPYIDIKRNVFTNRGYMLFPETKTEPIVFLDFIYNNMHQIDNIVELV